MTSAVQGQAATLTAEWRTAPNGPLDTSVAGVTITISRVADATVIVAGATTVTPLAGLSAYQWAVGSSLEPGPYAVQWSGTATSGAVSATEYVDVIAGPADVYASLAELKEYRRRNAANDTADDATMTARLLVAARRIDDHTGRRFYLDDVATARTFTSAGRVTPGGLLLVDDIGSTDGLVVESGAGGVYSTVLAEAYEPWPENALAQRRPIEGFLRLAGAWPCGTARGRITARWGWPAPVPPPVKESNLILASRLLKRRDSPEGLAASGDWGAINLRASDPDVADMLHPYVRPGFG